ncbi:MAG: phytanoyl-CoA dioxygenase family protein [Candidatus Latescibacteria bacterium]|jgi:ectoine hydroxylase-related dioxygenase (phytanoyl-CoA dioxygenase family)|nr:phytanoyl-CoA dioxygenase family protein [Candidatus Latescibacterota bacterium]
METPFRELDEQGYTVLEDLLTSQQVEKAIEALRGSYQESHVSAHEPGSLRTHNLTARAEIFREIIQLPRLVACMAHLLGPDYILSDMGARSPSPGMPAQGLHRDGGPFVPNPPYNAHMVLPLAAQSLMALSAFTAENGATRLVPGSHLRDIESATVSVEEERLFLCDPGAVLIYDNRMIHGGGANTTGEIRYAVQGFCCRSTTSPFCDHTRSITKKLVEKATPLLRRLWGFECQSAWEESPREFKIVEAPGAKPRFDYNRGIR